MDVFEELTMWHLTHNGKVFVCPQFSIDGDWSVPDFVALDFEKHRVMVVEASVAASPRGLFDKVKNRDNQWFARLRERLRQRQVIDDSWATFCVRLYIRTCAAEKLPPEISAAKDVEICQLEQIAFPWSWEWESTKLRKEAEETGQP